MLVPPKEEIINIFKQSDAILRGHFILSSGLHSDTYLQCARVLMDPKRAEILCRSLASMIADIIDLSKITKVVSPAMGGVIVGYEMARQLGKEAIFLERVDGKFNLRRGFTLNENDSVLVIEDVVTTGKSSIETFDCIKSFGSKIIAEGSLIDRSNGDVQLGVPFISLLTLDVKTFAPDNIPEELRNIPAIKPGSRFIKA